jgi:hypothetical protein
MPTKARSIRPQRQKRVRSKADRLRSSQLWRQTSLSYLAAHPICESKGCTQAAHDVHHVRRLNAGGSLVDWDNLMAVCRSCHARIEYGTQSHT